MNLLFPLILLLAPIKLETGHFTIYQDGKKIGTENFTISKSDQGYLVRGQTNIAGLDISSRMELNEKLVPTFYEYSNAQGTIRIKVSTPTSELESIVDGDNSSIDFRFPEGGLILDNNFFHHYLIMLYRAQRGQTMFPVFVPQDMRVGTATVRSTGQQTYDLEAGDVKLQAATDSDGRLIRLEVPDAKVLVER